MDPISLIIAAITAGATAAAQDTASNIVKDAYTGLKRLIRHRFSGNPEAEAQLANFEHQVGADSTGVDAQLRAAGADRDEELVKAAQALLEKIDPAGTKAGKYNVRITGSKGISVGDHANITMTFNDSD